MLAVPTKTTELLDPVLAQNAGHARFESSLARHSRRPRSLSTSTTKVRPFTLTRNKVINTHSHHTAIDRVYRCECFSEVFANELIRAAADEVRAGAPASLVSGVSAQPPADPAHRPAPNSTWCSVERRNVARVLGCCYSSL